ncbi:MAG TPA: tRNA-(ms[2]io[6]A)-hydroxylase [Polyangiaceae bacterium]|nr:tRNA-(ms[2]io[6]A)-hydroxylase [Polyangiaceae bacterium]
MNRRLDARGRAQKNLTAMLELRAPTPAQWLPVVLGDFDAFLIDHAACERKASATGMSLVVKYPDRAEMLDALIEFSQEELQHFHIVYRLCAARGLVMVDDYRDDYVRGLREMARTASEWLLLDRLLVAGVVEARGCERLGLVADALADPKMAAVYHELTKAEARHHGLFFRLARLYYDERTVRSRADELLDAEAELMLSLPLRAAVH